MTDGRLRLDVPIFHLRQFASAHSGLIDVYDLESGERRDSDPQASLPGDVSSWPASDGETHGHDVATLLATVDAVGEPLYADVVDGTELAGDRRHAFAFLVASLYVRSPFMRRQSAQDSERMTSVAGHSHAALDDGWGALQRAMQPRATLDAGAMLRASRLLADPDRFATFAAANPPLALLGRLATVARAIFDMQWTVTRASGGSFITSDSPVNLGANGPARSGLLGVGLAAANAMLSLPLSPAACWLAHWGRLPDPRAWRTAAAVQELNRRRVEQAARAIVATPHAHNLEGLARHRRTNVVKLVPFGQRRPVPRR